MLQFIRDRAQGVIAWVIVILIIIPFALWGINEYFGGGTELPVARVNNADIPQRDFQLVYQQVRNFRQSLMGDNFNPAFMDENDIKRDALDRLVRREVLAQSARDAGFRVGDSQVGQTITRQQEFQSEGRFDPELYKRLLGAQGLTPAKFELSLHQDLLANQLLTGLGETEMVMDYEVDNILRVREQQRKLGYLVLKADDYLEDAEISDDEIDEYYQAHPDRFAVPEQVSIEYLELSANTIAQSIKVDDEILRKMYEEQVASFTVGGERHAKHILIKIEEDADDQVVNAAQAKAQELLEKIRAGEDFDKLARENSDDTGSAAEGGDLGFFARGVMVKPFEDTVFLMSVGEVSEPVRSPFGFHIIKLVDIKAGHTQSFDEVRATLEQELKLPIISTGLFSRNNGQGIAADPKIREAAFSIDILEAKNNSEPIELEQNHLIVLRLKERKMASTRPQDEVKDQIISQLQLDKARQAAEAAGKALLQRAVDGENIELLADESRLEWIKTGYVGRNDSPVAPDIVRAAFKMPKPETSSPVTEGFSLPEGDYAIVSVYEVRNGDPAAVDEAARESLKTSILRSNGQQISSSVYDGLKSRAKITEYTDRL